MRKMRLLLVGIVSLLLPILLNQVALQAAPGFADPNFQQVWERADKLLTERNNIGRGYIWGPASVYIGREPYAEAPSETRLVQYFDKARMEVNNPMFRRTDPYFVTTGLLVKELVLGRMQVGDNVTNFIQGSSSTVQVVGDPNLAGANLVAPTYRTFRQLATFNNDNQVENRTGQQVKERIDKFANITQTSSPDPNVHLATYNIATHHNVADVFVAYGNLQGLVWNGSGYIIGQPFYPDATYVFGLPITEPYWTRAVVAGIEKDVLVQLFERRTLTYTPSNDANSKVEMGNVGQHYYRWRYLENIGLGSTPPAPFNDYSQARMPYLKSGPVVQGSVIHYQTSSPFSSSWPVYDPDTKLAMISTGQGMFAVDLTNFTNPTLRWRFLDSNAFTPITLFNQVVYCGGEGGKIFALNEQDGSLLWQTTLGGAGFDSLIVPDNSSLYFRRDWDGSLYALNRSDGSVRWAVRPENGATVTSGPIMGTDGTLYIGASDSRVYAFRFDGNQVEPPNWSPPLLDSIPNRYALAYANRRLYVGTANGTLYALSANGVIQSLNKLSGGQGILTVPAVAEGRVYVGSDEGRIFGLDASNLSQVQWVFKAPMGTPYARSSVAVVDGLVYFAMDDRNIYRVEATNPANYRVLATTNEVFGTNPVVINSGYLIAVSRDGVLHFVK
jgi:outer membrane protein assembly factor BamB